MNQVIGTIWILFKTIIQNQKIWSNCIKTIIYNNKQCFITIDFYTMYLFNMIGKSILLYLNSHQLMQKNALNLNVTIKRCISMAC